MWTETKKKIKTAHNAITNSLKKNEKIVTCGNMKGIERETHGVTTKGKLKYKRKQSMWMWNMIGTKNVEVKCKKNQECETEI